MLPINPVFNPNSRPMNPTWVAEAVETATQIIETLKKATAATAPRPEISPELWFAQGTEGARSSLGEVGEGVSPEDGGAREEAPGSQGGEAVNKGPDNNEEEEEEDERALALQARAQYRREAMSAIYTAFDALNASETADGEIDLQEFMLVGKVAFLPRRPL